MEEGERNTRFFHKSVIIKRNRSKILCLRDEVGNAITNPSEISTHILGFYIKLYSSEHIECPRTYRDHPSDPSQTDISQVPGNDEIRKALFCMKPLKAPGPDGFHPLFFQHSWEITGGDVCTNIRNWFHQGQIPGDLSHALICLIPKQKDPETI